MRRFAFAFVLLALLDSAASAQQPDAAKLAANLAAASAEERYAAADALTDLGVANQPATAQLVAALAGNDPQLRWRAARALGAGGNATAVAALGKAAADADALVRAQAIFALGRLGASDKPSVEAIIARLTDSDAGVRRACVRAMQMIKPDRKVTIPLVVKLLEDSDPNVAMRALSAIAEGGAESVPALAAALEHPEARYWACLALSEMGPQAKAAVPGLTKALADERPEVRLQSAIALAEIGPDAQPAVAALVKLLADPFESIRPTAAFALGRIGDKSAAEALGKLQTSTDPRLQSLCIWALAKMYPEDKDRLQKAVGHLVLKLADKDRSAAHMAARAISELSPPDEVIRPAMDKLLAGADAETADRVFSAYASLGPKIIPLAMKALKDPSATRRERALQVLARLGADAAPATAELAAIIKSDTPQHKAEALYVIAAIGPKANAAAVAAAVGALADADPQVKMAAGYAVGKIGPAAKEALPVLRQLATSDDELLKLSSVWAMLQIGVMNDELTKAAVPMLAKALSSEREFVRVEAAMSLGKLGSAAASAVPSLEKAQQDASAAVRNAAAEALKLIKGN